MIRKINKKYEKGIGALEAIISLAVVTTAIAGVILVVFGNQDIELDNEVNNIALYSASELIEIARVDGAVDFNSVVSTIPATDGIFTESLIVHDISPCRKDVTGYVYWSVQSRPQDVYLTTSLVSAEELAAMGGDCDLSSGPISEWWYPRTLVSVDLKDLGGPNNGISATSIDVVVRDGSTYVVLSTNHSTFSVEDLWVIDVTDIADWAAPYTAVLEGAVNTSSGLNDVDMASNYAFATNNESSKQFHSIDLNNLTMPDGIASVSLSGVDPTGSYPQGRAIFYYNDKAYVGIKETAGPEFHIYDVSDPFNLDPPLGTLELTHNINDIIVRGNYAYLATSDNAGEVMIIDISDPTNLEHPDDTGMKFDAPGSHDGTALYLLGNRLYLGRKSGDDSPNEPNFYILDISDPSAIGVLGSKFIKRNPVQPLGVTAIVTSGQFAFIGTDDSNAEFQVYKIEDPTNIVNCSEPGYPGGFAGCGKYDFPAKISDLEYRDSLIYASVESNDAFRVIFDDISLY